MKITTFKIRRFFRHLKYSFIKRVCTDEEWKTLHNIRAGYYGYYGRQEKLLPISTSFELNDASYRFLHSTEGEEKYDAQYGIAHKLIRDKEEEIARCVSYVEAWDAKRKTWVCTAELNLIKKVK